MTRMCRRASLSLQYTKVALASLACADMPRNTGDRKVKHESYGYMIDMEMSTFEITLMAVTIGGCVINRDCVITFINKRDVYLSGSSRYFN